MFDVDTFSNIQKDKYQYRVTCTIQKAIKVGLCLTSPCSLIEDLLLKSVIKR